MYHVVQIIQSYDVISKRPLGCQSGHMIGSFAPVPRVLSTSITGRNTAKSIHPALFPTLSQIKSNNCGINHIARYRLKGPLTHYN